MIANFGVYLIAENNYLHYTEHFISDIAQCPVYTYAKHIWHAFIP